MKDPNVKFPPFFISELKGALTSFPQMSLLSLFSISTVLLTKYHNCLTDISSAILEGVVSGYIFYLFVDPLPKMKKKILNIKKISLKLSQILLNINQFKQDIKAEISTYNNETCGNIETFFSLLKNISGTHLPVTTAMKRINSATQGNNIQPIQFNYSNLEEILNDELIRLKIRLEGLERTCTIYGLAEINPELMQIISDLSSASPFSKIKNNFLFKNTPALFGSDFDYIEGVLLRMKTSLENDYGVKF